MTVDGIYQVGTRLLRGSLMVIILFVGKFFFVPLRRNGSYSLYMYSLSSHVSIYVVI